MAQFPPGKRSLGEQQMSLTSLCGGSHLRGSHFPELLGVILAGQQPPATLFGTWPFGQQVLSLASCPAGQGGLGAPPEGAVGGVPGASVVDGAPAEGTVDGVPGAGVAGGVPGGGVVDGTLGAGSPEGGAWGAAPAPGAGVEDGAPGGGVIAGAIGSAHKPERGSVRDPGGQQRPVLLSTAAEGQHCSRGHAMPRQMRWHWPSMLETCAPDGQFFCSFVGRQNFPIPATSCFSQPAWQRGAFKTGDVSAQAKKPLARSGCEPWRQRSLPGLFGSCVLGSNPSPQNCWLCASIAPSRHHALQAPSAFGEVPCGQH